MLRAAAARARQFYPDHCRLTFASSPHAAGTTLPTDERAEPRDSPRDGSPEIAFSVPSLPSSLAFLGTRGERKVLRDGDTDGPAEGQRGEEAGRGRGKREGRRRRRKILYDGTVVLPNDSKRRATACGNASRRIRSSLIYQRARNDAPPASTPNVLDPSIRDGRRI